MHIDNDLPKNGGIFLVSDGENVGVGRYFYGIWLDINASLSSVVYWMPLPNPPKE